MTIPHGITTLLRCKKVQVKFSIKNSPVLFMSTLANLLGENILRSFPLP